VSALTIQALVALIMPRSGSRKLLGLFISGYFDESGTHGSPFTVMGGYVTSAAHWGTIEWDWKALLAAKGVDSYHSTQFFARSGQFKGWTERDQRNFAKAAFALLREQTYFSIVAVVVNRDHAEFKRTVGVKNYHYSDYGLAFHYCMANSVEHVRRSFPDEQVSFVIEAGHKNAGGVTKVFNTAKFGKLNYAGKPALLSANLGALAFASDLPGLETADFLVNRAFRDLSRGKFKSRRGTSDARALLNKQYFETLREPLRATIENAKRFSASRLKSAKPEEPR
jgi:hypothetical protein